MFKSNTDEVSREFTSKTLKNFSYNQSYKKFLEKSLNLENIEMCPYIK